MKKPDNAGFHPAISEVPVGGPDLGNKAGFQVSGYINKKGTPYGEGARFNYLPPGMDITNQDCADIRDLPMKKVTEESYPGDGW